MLMAEGSSNLLMEGSSNMLTEGCSNFSEHDWSVDDDLSIDADTFFEILAEPNEANEDSDCLLTFPGNLSLKNASEDEAPFVGNHENSQLHTGKPQVIGAPPIGVGLEGPPCFTENTGVLVPTCSTSSSFAEGDANNVTDLGDNSNVNMLQEETVVQFRHGGDIDREYVSQYGGPENMDVDLIKYRGFRENTIETMDPPVNNLSTSVEMTFMNADMSSRNIPSAESTICQGTDIMSDYSAFQYGLSMNDTIFSDATLHHLPNSYTSQFFPVHKETMSNVKHEIVEFPSESECSSNRMRGQGMRIGTEMSVIDYSDVKGWNYGYEGNNYMSSAATEALICSQSYMPSETKAFFVEEESNDELFTPSSIMWQSDDITDETFSRKNSYSVDDKFFDEDLKPSFTGISCSFSGQKTEDFTDEKGDMIVASNRDFHSQGNIRGSVASTVYNSSFDLNASEDSIPCTQPFFLSMNQPKCLGSHLSKVSPESTHSNFSEKSIVEDDSDVCIIEHMSHPAPTSRSPPLRNTLVTSQHCTIGESYMGAGGMRLKAKDESLILRQALQDLSQPKSEASPPDGVLAVPLLRHQRIALSWMVQKETANMHCAGGILADDQGLGKTVSTIALILKERPPSSRPCQYIKRDMETLNLDEDDDLLPKLGGTKLESESLTNTNSLMQAIGRPAAGTLIVCPTSVLRQWAEELHNKVTSKANLSVLVYHGSNRTKDPCELTKYDVVLTTYSIVSMEVPKLPLFDEYDEEKEKPDYHAHPSMGLSSSKKRKYPPSSDKNSLKGKKGLSGAVVDSVARPLAKVGWFRVVLDEAQSIKNHRTQAARACWGLRAKRRWCLSGTPIQNAIDDLYSYFRFLKYDPYAVYRTFCSSIKVPISKSPSKGYKKLQAVLKTIMLRRTKGTLLDGKPIISLPPKFIEMKKVDFSREERDFYSRLESDSRAQFQEYAAAGTVKQNYVNILLMLLRLRQACDHPLLVKPFDSQSLLRSSVEMAKKLSRDEQINLLNCLEASLAICGICNDPPEDAVVSKCGHVFCHQCICEHLTGDDNECPNTNCKVRLNVSSVFSKATLNSSLCDQAKQDNSSNSADSEVVETVESFYDDPLFNSSKINAALEVLQSICKPQDYSSGNISNQNSSDGSLSCAENSSDTRAIELLQDIPDRQNLDVEKSSINSVKVVGQKAIVFSQWTRMLDLLETRLKNSSIQYRRLDGTMSVIARDKAVKDFNTLPEVSVIVMSLKAASLGLNMVAACHVLLLDLWWNPTTEDQAVDRAHRIGQTRPVTVLRLTVRDTVEDRILALQEKKREMVASAFGEDKNGGRQTRLTVEDLKYLFMM
ncbi:hypothetical protein FNV43_RR07626 [Rhamnella rubrinervis]|uniref:Helicase-like transcription factor CHR28 n=1 Tax=Rhamnella rubrinervis TaxID=2594499 RepID=A0A8K0HF42_9ROSA|nr:hypothetical protein FNV43_RR07626 [Rhamnella rubrinervis]